MTRPRAAVDSGSNSTRLLVVDAEGRQVVRASEVTRLGQGVDATGHLADEAVARTLEVVARYRDRWRAAGVADADVRIAATAAVRDARDGQRYLDAVGELTGVRAEVLSGDAEARLSFAGAAAAVDVPGPLLVVDVGGSSTELVVGGADGVVVGAHSMQVGAVRVTERHLHGDPPTDAEVVAARAMLAEALDEAADRLARAGVRLGEVAAVVGVAGTPATIGARAAGLDRPDHPAVHGTTPRRDEVADWTARLLAMTAAERARLPGVPPGRADVLGGGALVLDAVLARTGRHAMTVSLADNLDGLVASLA